LGKSTVVFCGSAAYTMVNTISRNHESLQFNTQENNMKYISDKMLAILERLAEMFPGSNYQSRLDAYLSTKGITDAAQLETYIRQFNSQKENYL
jgi:hypothetical protein